MDSLARPRGRSKTRVFSVCGEDGQSLPCTYHEVDRDMGSARQGERVVVVARGQADGTLQVHCWGKLVASDTKTSEQSAKIMSDQWETGWRT